MAGLFRKTDRAPRGVIVCAHPLRRDAKGFFLRYGHAEALLRSGYHVLLFDFNGFGESGGGGCLYPLDVIAAGHHAAQLAPGLPVGALGASFGAAWVACALADARHHFDAAVLENPFTTLSAYFGCVPWQARTLRALSRWMPREAVALCPVERLCAARRVRSLLFVYGERDAITPVTAGLQLMRSCAHNRRRRSAADVSQPLGFELWMVPGAGHNEVIRTAPQAYRARMEAAFERAFSADAAGTTRQQHPAAAAERCRPLERFLSLPTLPLTITAGENLHAAARLPIGE